MGKTQKNGIHIKTAFLAIMCCLFVVLLSTKTAYAAPAEGATVEYSGTSGTVTWEIYTDGTMVIRPTSGDEGTMASLGGSANGSPWYRYRTSIKSVETQGTIHLGQNASYMFDSMPNCASMDLSGFDTSAVVDMKFMFRSCSATRIDGISNWNTSNVTSMRAMFDQSKAVNIGELSNWNTSNVTNMENMFSGSAATSFDIDNWDTSKVTDMSGMFQLCKAASLDLSNWNTSAVTDMNYMFNSCKELASLNINGLKTGNVTNMRNMFSNCPKLASIDLSGFDTSKVADMSYMFESCDATVINGLAGWNTSSVKNMSSMFNLSKATRLDLSGWDTSNVTGMSYMFYHSNAAEIKGISDFNMSKVTDISYMFNGSKVKKLDLSKWNMPNLRYMSNIFNSCAATDLNVSGWNTSGVTYMEKVFYKSAATSLDLSSWDTSNVTSMRDMFYNANVRTVLLGENFRFKGKNIAATNSQAVLPNPWGSAYTGKWIREDGTVEAKTREELRDQYDANASVWAGKWIWEEKPTKYTVKFNPPAGGGYAGSMPDQKIAASEAGVLNGNAFSRFDYSFDHWDGSDGRTYTDGQTIPANTFNVGDTLILTAVFTKDQHVLSFIDGVAEFTLKAGEKAVFSDLPGGSKYQIWEEAPSGWQLIDQTNAAGTVVPNQTTDASFTNEYVPGTATFTLMAQKTLDGTLPGDGQFEFELIASDNTVVQTVSNNAAGIVQFDQIVFRQPGTYVYQIREVRGDDPGISYDAHTEVVTITVSDDGHGNLTATSSSMTTLPSFENETKPGMLTVEKKVEGGSSDQVFTFEIELTNDKGMPLSNVHVVGETAE